MFLARSGVPRCPLDLLLTAVPVRSLELSFLDWHLDRGAGSFWDLCSIAAITRGTNPKVCFEIGTGHGRTSIHLALNAPSDAEITTLDISSEHPCGMMIDQHPELRNIRRVFGDSRTFDYGPWKGRVNLVIVDGAHDFETVRIDTEKAFELLAPEGWILWDDFDPGFPGVVRALELSSRRADILHITGTKLAVYSSRLKHIEN